MNGEILEANLQNAFVLLPNKHTAVEGLRDGTDTPQAAAKQGRGVGVTARTGADRWRIAESPVTSPALSLQGEEFTHVE